MATWVTHLMMADKMFEWGLPLDERGFCVGSVGPDCNVESTDWKEFTPPKEVTHWMTEKGNKMSADYEGFIEKEVRMKQFISEEEFAFLLGYYSHLVADVQMQRFVRNERRIQRVFSRLDQNPEMKQKIKDMPKTIDTLKNVFGRRMMTIDIYYIERDYLREHPEARFDTILRKTKEFPDYLDYFPTGAIARKLAVIDELNDYTYLPPTPEVLLFFEKEEYLRFVEDTSRLIYENLQKIISSR